MTTHLACGFITDVGDAAMLGLIDGGVQWSKVGRSGRLDASSEQLWPVCGWS
jgi:hypothetical protein